jgi:hypothetical protein
MLSSTTLSPLISPILQTFETSLKKDNLAIKTVGAALEGTKHPLIISSGTLGFSLGQLATEQDKGDPAKNAPLSFRRDHSFIFLKRCAVVGHSPSFIATTREKGVSAYIGEGTKRWPAVHRFDAAHLYRLALEKGALGAIYHGIAEEGIAFRDIAQAIGKQLDVPVVSKSIEEAVSHFGWIGNVVTIGNPTSSKKTQQELDWHPTRISLLADIKELPGVAHTPFPNTSNTTK